MKIEKLKINAAMIDESFEAEVDMFTDEDHHNDDGSNVYLKSLILGPTRDFDTLYDPWTTPSDAER